MPVLLPLLLCCAVLRADPPGVDSIFPAGGARGSTNEVTITGKFAPWPPQVWVLGGGVSFEAKTNSGKFLVAIATNAAPGPRLLRLHNADGASEWRFFVVGDGREVAEAETNNHFAQPQALDALPVTVNGQLNRKDDVDSFSFALRAGEWIEARADCYTLMGKADLVLRLLTTNGVQLAWNHDFASLDPRLVWRATNDVTVVLQCFGFAYPADSDIRLTGGEGTAYRLHIALSNAPVNSVCGDGRESQSTAREVVLPVEVAGVLDRPRAEHRYNFAAKMGEFIEATVAAAALGSPLDASLHIENASGDVLAKNDDADGRADPHLEWKASSNGTFTVVVSPTLRRGGAEHCYRLSVRNVAADYRATLAASLLVLKPGATNELKMNLKRLRGFTNELSVIVRGLPDGVTALTTNIPEKEEIALKLNAATNAAPFSGSIEVLLRDQATGSERIVPFELTSRSSNNGVPGGYQTLLISRAEPLWLTVTAPAKKNGK